MQPPSSRQKKQKILAYDGTYVTDFNYHSIDSIVQDAKKVAKESVNMLIKLINDQPLKKREVLVPVKYKRAILCRMESIGTKECVKLFL